VVDFLKELLIAIIFRHPRHHAVCSLMRVASVAAEHHSDNDLHLALGIFYACGMELNTVTLAALIVTLGMIVDNSYRHHRLLHRED
jgi:multidrug efflux pump